MAKTDIRDKNGKLQGFIVAEDNGKQEIRDQNGNLKGFYDPITNTTKDKNQVLQGKGNFISALLTKN